MGSIDNQNEKVKTIPYNHGKIYKLVSNSTSDIYIGSSCNKLSVRLGAHKNDYSRWINGKSTNQLSSFEIVKHGDAQIILIETVCVETKEALTARERFHIENNICVNQYLPGGMSIEEMRQKKKNDYNDISKNIKGKAKEYYTINKEKIIERQKQYNQNNKEDVINSKKQYYIKNKDMINDKHKQYRADNKEQISEKLKKYRADNKEEISYKAKLYNENNKEKLNKICVCDCGGKFQYKSLTSHTKSYKHLNYESKIKFDTEVNIGTDTGSNSDPL
jgi:hypothetical protein